MAATLNVRDPYEEPSTGRSQMTGFEATTVVQGKVLHTQMATQETTPISIKRRVFSLDFNRELYEISLVASPSKRKLQLFQQLDARKRLFCLAGIQTSI